ncbi:unnamed protein product [Vicia faba]|uniref:Uncharacterized protein n=1 Tax=Vicia faba TaxID=3906 RepID=A0AAV1B3A9_VICFA|nr:unnamed protein product [Vicia faba]
MWIYHTHKLPVMALIFHKSFSMYTLFHNSKAKMLSPSLVLGKKHMKGLLHQLNGTMVPPGKEKTISKCEVGDLQPLTFSVIVKVRVPLHFMEILVKILHGNNKYKWGQGVTLFDSSSSHQAISVSAINIEHV